MLLHVSDFGCAADGRFLVRAAISASSVELTDPDNTFRPTDIGKNIAVPGALDLVATIAKLVDRKDVVDSSGNPCASMTAGSTTLTAQLPAGQRFRPDLHLGLRISVVGAGAAGATLISDVVHVEVDGNTLQLANAASTTVTNAVAILNRPDRVALSNYARATTPGDVAVDLGDRPPVTDARMTVGQRALVSAAAKFSSVDLGKSVTIQGAGLLVTTIQSFTSNTLVKLAAPAQRTVTSGPADVWQTDSRPGFELLLASLGSLDVESTEIVFEPGVYDFTRTSTGPLKLNAAIGLRALRNLTIRGAGRGATVLRLMPNQDLHGPDTHVMELRDCQNITLRDLSVHGAYLTMRAVNEQMHGININAGCEDLIFERVLVFQSAGDGIRFLGDGMGPTGKVQRIWVEDCSFVQNKRAGVSFQRAAEFVWIRDCYIEMTPPSTDSCIHFEPSGTTAPADVVIDSNVLVHGTDATAVSISGISGDDPTRRVRFANNTLSGGSIGGVDAVDVTIAHNTIETGDREPAATFRGNYDSLRIESNRIVVPGVQRPAIQIAELNGFTSNNVWIVDNQIETPGDGIFITNPGNHFEIRGNQIFGAGGNFFGIVVVLASHTAGVHRDFKILGNTVGEFTKVGIQLSTFNTSERFEGVAVEGNEIYVTGAVPSDAAAIRFAKPGGGTGRWLVHAVVAGNRISDNFQLKIDRHAPTVPFVAVSGNPGARAVYEGDGSPEGLVAAPFGSLFMRIDLASDTALYLKRSGDAETGWVAIATV
jgi:hypothetical protein